MTISTRIPSSAKQMRPIRSQADYEKALSEIDAIMNAEAGTREADRLEVLAILVGVYEDEHFALDLPDPIEAIKHWMEAQGLSRRDLEKYLGTRARVAEILNRRRPLTLTMIRKLSSATKIPASVLIRPSVARARQGAHRS